MARIRSKNTLIERTMAKELLDAGLVFESHCRDLPGTPDFVFRESKVAVFCDSEFWHGYRMGPKALSKYSHFWREKLDRNRKKDRLVNRELGKLGWKVIRLWGREITRDPTTCVSRIAHSVS